MTEKRFVSEDNCYGYYTEIIDSEKELDLSLPNPKKNLTLEELVDLLNELSTKCSQLEKENEQLKQFIKELTTKGTGRIDLANGYSYNVSAVLTDYRGDVE